ncbi:MAG: protein kinase family protein [Deltaproteobacteria bacterium]|nr:protein kinase family protein [Deltaproteobacteria bacterium]MBI2975134.1 protein kinase family protein [Deltaproteobacteria bacterium]
MMQDFSVIRELREAEETSSWIKSVIAVMPDTGSPVIISRLNKEKLIKHYSYAPNAEKLSASEQKAILERAELKFVQEAKDFIEINKKVIGLSHSNIVGVLHVDKDQTTGEDIIVREFFSGISLYDMTEGMAVEGMIPLFLGLIDAVDFIHRHKFLHLNLKPKKVRISESINGYTIKLADFGYAADKKSNPETIHGVLAFGAPEVLLRDKDKFGEGSDIFSIGAIMYYCMTRAWPFPQREGAKDFGRLIEILKNEHMPMKPSAANPAILDTAFTAGIRYKKDIKKISQFEDAVMDIISERKIQTAGELHRVIMDIFPDITTGQVISSATITSGI